MGNSKKATRTAEEYGLVKSPEETRKNSRMIFKAIMDTYDGRPMMHVFEEGEFIIVTGEMSEVGKEDVRCELEDHGRFLRIYTEGERRYDARIALPCLVTEEIELSCKESGYTVKNKFHRVLSFKIKLVAKSPEEYA